LAVALSPTPTPTPTIPQRPFRRWTGTDELQLAMQAVDKAVSLSSALRQAEHLRSLALRSLSPQKDARRLATWLRSGDDVSALAALHALASVADSRADHVLLDLLVGGDPCRQAHAAWALSARRSSRAAMAPLVRMVSRGGFAAMLAERTLLEWADREARPTLATIQSLTDLDQAGRSRLDALQASLLDHVQRKPVPPRPRPTGEGIVVIQPFLHAHIDRDGSGLGVGDAGGIASLLRSLGTALAALPQIDQVVTLTRRQGNEPRQELLSPRHRVERLEIGPFGPLPCSQAWPYRIAIQKEFESIGQSLGHRNVVWHLRMADVGTLAAAAAAQRLGQPVIFTAAPDPHLVLDALLETGRLSRRHFGQEDAVAHYWFRSRMVERLMAHSDRLVLLPRPNIQRDLVELVGLDGADLARRSTTLAEGVDVGQIDRAQQRLASHGTAPAVDSILQSLPAARRGLPWLLLVGRLTPTKGAQRFVEAVLAHSSLSSQANIVLVGGDLQRPSDDEKTTLELIRRAAAGAPEGLVTLTGHLPPTAVSDLLVHAAAHAGVYVCASDKEEFGLAIIEALAAGMVVVAPCRGGPRNYIQPGDTGVLCDTLSVSQLGLAIKQAWQMANDTGRAKRAQAMVRRDLSVEEMARGLSRVYASALIA
jgi:glycosyltransferase involved in cell wall biosynthesis